MSKHKSTRERVILEILLEGHAEKPTISVTVDITVHVLSLQGSITTVYFNYTKRIFPYMQYIAKGNISPLIRFSVLPTQTQYRATSPDSSFLARFITS